MGDRPWPVRLEIVGQDMDGIVVANANQARRTAQRQGIELGAHEGKDPQGEPQAQERRQLGVQEDLPAPKGPGRKGADEEGREIEVADDILADDALAFGRKEVAPRRLQRQPLEGGQRQEVAA